MSGGSGGEFHLEAEAAWPVGRFAALEAVAGLTHAVTTRQGLDAATARDDPAATARIVAERTGLQAIAFCKQVHGPDVLVVDSGGPAGEADGLVTDRPGLGVMAFSADCPLVLVAHTGGRAVAVAHASWRSTVAGVSRRMIETLVGAFGVEARDLVACIAPSAGPCCYEVGGEVVDAAVRALGLGAQRFFRELRPGKFLFDLWAANRDQLLRAGVGRGNLHTAGICTICRNDLLPSYRVEGPSAGRFVAVIGRQFRS